MTHTAVSSESSTGTTVWPLLASISARPSLTLGNAAWTVTLDTAARVLLPTPYSDGQFFELAAAHDGGSHLAADAIGAEQALQIVGVAHAVAVQPYQDVALEEASGGRGTTVGNLHDQQAALLPAGELFGGRGPSNWSAADAQVAAPQLAMFTDRLGDQRQERPRDGDARAAKAEAARNHAQRLAIGVDERTAREAGVEHRVDL